MEADKTGGRARGTSERIPDYPSPVAEPRAFPASGPAGRRTFGPSTHFAAFRAILAEGRKKVIALRRELEAKQRQDSASGETGDARAAG